MNNRLFVGNLDYSVRDDSLREFFSQVGEVEYAKVIMDRETGRSRGFGFVEMKTDEDAQAAIERFDKNELFMDRELNVNIAKPRD